MLALKRNKHYKKTSHELQQIIPDIRKKINLQWSNRKFTKTKEIKWIWQWIFKQTHFTYSKREYEMEIWSWR